MDAQVVVGIVVAVPVAAYVTVDNYVRGARRRDAVRAVRAGHGGPVVPRQRPAGEPYREVDRPDEKPEERHEPRPVGTR